MALIYRPNENSTWRVKLSKILASNKPVFFIKLETTGLDAKGDDICRIRVLKTEFRSGELVIIDEFNEFIKTDKLSAEITKINGITEEILAKRGKALTEVFAKLNTFLGKEVNLVSFSVANFIGPFLTEAEKRTGIKLNIANTLDLYQMSLSLVLVSKYAKSYGHSKLGATLKVVSTDVLGSYVDMFNKMYKLVPKGTYNTFNKFVKSVKLWKNKGVSYLYIDTEYGIVRLNVLTGFFEEDTKGFFSQIDMDAFSEYLCKKRKVENLRGFIDFYVR